LDSIGDYSALELSVDDSGTATVSLNRPDLHNAFNETLIAEISECFTRLGGDDNVQLVVLTGSGKSFCAGADINWMKKMIEYSREENIADSQKLADMFKIIDECPKPVIGRVNGAAFGGGVGLVAVCDVAVASEKAKFSFSEVKLGIIPAVVSPYVIARIGPGHSRHLFITGERFDTSIAYDIGLVHHVAPPELLDEEVQRLSEVILANGPKAMAECKVLVAKWRQMEAETFRKYTVEKIAELRTGPEGNDGLKAFLEKRKPGWRRS
jgi:methylglutaconyl-CoA hydratase